LERKLTYCDFTKIQTAIDVFWALQFVAVFAAFLVLPGSGLSGTAFAPVLAKIRARRF
jgi:hypothetical protein